MALKESWKGGFKSVTPKHDLLYTNYTDMKSFKEKAVPTRMHRPLIAIKNLSFCVSKSGFRGMITIWIKDTRSKSKSFHFRTCFRYKRDSPQLDLQHVIGALNDNKAVVSICNFFKVKYFPIYAFRSWLLPIIEEERNEFLILIEDVLSLGFPV